MKYGAEMRSSVGCPEMGETAPPVDLKLGDNLMLPLAKRRVCVCVRRLYRVKLWGRGGKSSA